jgi:hypothetical protein
MIPAMTEYCESAAPQISRLVVGAERKVVVFRRMIILAERDERGDQPGRYRTFDIFDQLKRLKNPILSLEILSVQGVNRPHQQVGIGQLDTRRSERFLDNGQQFLLALDGLCEAAGLGQVLHGLPRLEPACLAGVPETGKHQTGND